MRALLRAPLVVMGAGLVLAVSLVALLAPALAPFDPRALSGDAFLPPSFHHPLGTNNIGQDIASQVIWGARSSLTLGLAVAALSVTLGLLIGMGAGLLGGLVDLVVMRVIDVVLAIPRLPLLVLVGALAGASRTSLVLVIALITCPVVARVLRSQVLRLRGEGFIESARGFGGGPVYVIRRHLVPAVAPLLVSELVLIAGTAVLLEAELAFLGLSDPTAVSWGLIINRALNSPGLYFTPAWKWWLLPPGFAIAATVIGFAFLGVGLEPVLNPRWQRAVPP